MDKETEKKWDEIVNIAEWHYRKENKSLYGRETTTCHKIPYPYNLFLDIELFLAFVLDDYKIKKPQEPVNVDNIFNKLSDEEKSLLYQYYNDKKKQVNICKGYGKVKDNIFRKLYKEIIEKHEQEKIISIEKRKQERTYKIWTHDKVEVKTGNIVNAGLSNRTTNALMRAGIFSIDDLFTAKISELKKIRGMGSCSLEEIKEFIEKKDKERA